MAEGLLSSPIGMFSGRQIRRPGWPQHVTASDASEATDPVHRHSTEGVASPAARLAQVEALHRMQPARPTAAACDIGSSLGPSDGLFSSIMDASPAASSASGTLRYSSSTRDSQAQGLWAPGGPLQPRPPQRQQQQQPGLHDSSSTRRLAAAGGRLPPLAGLPLAGNTPHQPQYLSQSWSRAGSVSSGDWSASGLCHSLTGAIAQGRQTPTRPQQPLVGGGQAGTGLPPPGNDNRGYAPSALRPSLRGRSRRSASSSALLDKPGTSAELRQRSGEALRSSDWLQHATLATQKAGTAEGEGIFLLTLPSSSSFSTLPATDAIQDDMASNPVSWPAATSAHHLLYSNNSSFTAGSSAAWKLQEDDTGGSKAPARVPMPTMTSLVVTEDMQCPGSHRSEGGAAAPPAPAHPQHAPRTGFLHSSSQGSASHEWAPAPLRPEGRRGHSKKPHLTPTASSCPTSPLMRMHMSSVKRSSSRARMQAGSREGGLQQQHHYQQQQLPGLLASSDLLDEGLLLALDTGSSLLSLAAGDQHTQPSKLVPAVAAGSSRARRGGVLRRQSQGIPETPRSHSSLSPSPPPGLTRAHPLTHPASHTPAHSQRTSDSSVGSRLPSYGKTTPPSSFASPLYGSYNSRASDGMIQASPGSIASGCQRGREHTLAGAQVHSSSHDTAADHSRYMGPQSPAPYHLPKQQGTHAEAQATTRRGARVGVAPSASDLSHPPRPPGAPPGAQPPAVRGAGAGRSRSLELLLDERVDLCSRWLMTGGLNTAGIQLESLGWGPSTDAMQGPAPDLMESLAHLGSPATGADVAEQHGISRAVDTSLLLGSAFQGTGL